jgi:hypothetical protein
MASMMLKRPGRLLGQKLSGNLGMNGFAKETKKSLATGDTTILDYSFRNPLL